MKSSDFIQLRFHLKYRYVEKRKRHRLILDAFNTLERIYIIMQNNYNINQLSLAMTTDYQPEKNHPAYYIHQLVENLTVSRGAHVNMILACF